MIDLISTIASQYANSPTLMALIADMNDYIDPTVDFDNFFNDIWNIQTASGYGLDVWGRIIGVNRVVKIIDSSPVWFGFSEAADIPLTAPQPFGQAPFYPGASAVASHNWSLPDSSYRGLILVKALANITDCSIPAINKILRNLFGALGQTYCTDTGNMTMTYTFEFAIDPVDYAIITQSGAMPRPTGVYATVIQTLPPIYLAAAGTTELIGTTDIP